MKGLMDMMGKGAKMPSPLAMGMPKMEMPKGMPAKKQMKRKPRKMAHKMLKGAIDARAMDRVKATL